MSQGYSLVKNCEAEKTKFWNYFDRIYEDLPYVSSLYSKFSNFYYEQKCIDEGISYDDLSFILLHDEKPIAGFLGCLIQNNGSRYIQNFDLPSFFIENYNGLSPKQRKKYFLLIDELLTLKVDFKKFAGVTNTNNISWALDYLMTKKNLRGSLKFKREIKLEDSEKKLKSNIRKSYHSLINWGLRELNLEVKDAKNINLKDIMALRELHFEEAGRRTRSEKSWIAQFEQIKNTPSFLVNGFLENKLVTSGLFICNKNHCYYGVSASKRAFFDKPLFHAVMWTAILKAKKSDINFFETGFEIVNNEEEIFSLKQKQIALFKSGFGGRLVPEIVVT